MYKADHAELVEAWDRFLALHAAASDRFHWAMGHAWFAMAVAVLDGELAAAVVAAVSVEIFKRNESHPSLSSWALGFMNYLPFIQLNSPLSK